MVQTITMKKVLIKAREYYDARKLQYQSRDYEVTRPGCMYDPGEGCRCVIGAALTPTTIKLLKSKGHNDSDIGHILDMGHVKFQSERARTYSDEIEDLIALQEAHDSAVNGNSEAKANFRKMLQHLEKKYGTR